MEHNLMKLGGSIGNIPQKMKNYIFRTISPLSRVQFIFSFYNWFFIFCGTLPSDPPNSQ
jgi:hypothetical protein